MAFQYEPSATGLALHNSSKFLKCLVGPYGSGKSCMCCMEILYNACSQTPAHDGVRYSRVGVIRSSYPELQSATRRSLIEILPSEYGTIVSTGSPMRGMYNFPLPDGTRVQLELELWSVQNEEDAERIKSANWSFAFINEATGCAAAVLPAVMSRIGRFPSQDMGGVSWAGVILDFNMPPPGSWLDDFINNPQDNWDIFKQPPAAFKRELENGEVVYEVNPAAENLRNLGAFQADDPPEFTAEQKGMRYYKNQIEALLKLGRVDIVENQYCLLPVVIQDGKPVFPNFRRDRHVARNPIEPVPFRNIIVGMDQSGIHPAAVIMQEQKGQWCVLDELYADGEGFETFLYGMLVPLLRRRYSSNPVIVALDPSNQKDSWQAVTPKERLADVGLVAVTEISNSPKVRIQAVEHMLNLYTGGLLISPTCEMVIRGFGSEYRYRRLRAAGTMGAVYTPQPEKNDASHLADAVQYACLLIAKGVNQEGSAEYDAAADLVARHRAKLSRVV